MLDSNSWSFTINYFLCQFHLGFPSCSCCYFFMACLVVTVGPACNRMGSSSGALNFSRIQSVMLLLSMLACDSRNDLT